MTPQEFKAWFDGFTEALDGEPNKAQWKRIKARVAEIDGKPITERVYVDRYLPWSAYPNRPIWTYTTCRSGGVGTYTASSVTVPVSFNSQSAMNALGRIEASNMAGA